MAGAYGGVVFDGIRRKHVFHPFHGYIVGLGATVLRMRWECLQVGY